MISSCRDQTGTKEREERHETTAGEETQAQLMIRRWVKYICIKFHVLIILVR